MNHDENKREWEAKIINMRRVFKLGKKLGKIKQRSLSNGYSLYESV
jgi:hypothetical protein